MLSNEKFVSKAPEAKVQEEREKLENLQTDDGAGDRKDWQGLKAKRSKWFSKGFV